MTQYLDPSFRPGRGETQRVVWLNKETQTAHFLWHAIYSDRYHKAYPDLHPDYRSRVHYDRLDATLTTHEGTLLGKLPRIAVDHARTRTLPNPNTSLLGPHSFAIADWEMANRLADEQARLDPPPVLVSDTSTRCRHKRPYAGECAEYDADEL